jgi:integrase
MNAPIRVTAERLLAKAEVALEDRKPLTFRQMVELYCLGKPPNSQRDYRLKRWLPVFGDRPAFEIPADDLLAVLDALEDAGYRGSTINRELADLSSIYAWAIKNRRKTGAPSGFNNPFAGREKLPEQTRHVHVTAEQEAAILLLSRAQKYPRAYALVLAAMTSGARRGELRRMRWEHIDWSAGVATIGVDKKSGRSRTLLLVPQLLAELKTFKQHSPKALVFCAKNDPYQYFDEKRMWTQMRKELGLQHLHWHDLRHHACARLLRSGASLHVTSKVLGHADARMVSRRYGSLEAGDLLAAATRAAEGLA